MCTQYIKTKFVSSLCHFPQVFCTVMPGIITRVVAWNAHLSMYIHVRVDVYIHVHVMYTNSVPLHVHVHVHAWFV